MWKKQPGRWRTAAKGNMGHGRVCRGICAAQFGKWLRKSEVRGGWKRLHSLSSRLRRRRCPCPGRRWGSQSWRADLEDPGRARVAGPEGRHLRTARLEAQTSYSQLSSPQTNHSSVIELHLATSDEADKSENVSSDCPSGASRTYMNPTLHPKGLGAMRAGFPSHLEPHDSCSVMSTRTR